jgi:hypothetical protein
MDFSFIKKKEFLYPCGSNKISCYPIEVILPAGAYRFECYGASGGTSGNGIGGHGAYVSGNIKLNTQKRMFLFIGAQGHATVGKPSFNGGGRGHLNSRSESGASGGGSTDIRLINSTGLEGFVSRIIVAGAGGGGESYYSGIKGGNAGIFTGEDGNTLRRTPTSSLISSSKGANVSAGGDGGQCVKNNDGSSCNNFHAFSGGFGFGGNGSNYFYGSGGGSGYFGGGGGAIAHYIVGSGAGGSSYVSGYEGFHSFDLENNELKDTLSEKHSSGLIFNNVDLKDGGETMYNGDGKIVITRIIFMRDSRRNQSNDYYYTIFASFLVLFS